ncbi:hypothetical protein PWT90_10144 [Aphanocladium album]|nr:hypothetical protein PWT90_10144 [Aphanocladium album]
MYLQAFVDTGNEWLNGELKTYIKSFINERTKCSSVVFLKDIKTAKEQDQDQILTYCFCDPPDNEQAFYRPSTSFMMSFFNHVDCWVYKDKLSILAEQWKRKRLTSMFCASLPETVCFQLDYADFLEEKFDEEEFCSLKQSLEENEKDDVSVDQRHWWILKPAMTDGGYGIRLFSSVAELRSWFEELPDDDTDTIVPEIEELPDGRLRSSLLRRFIAQRYVASIPLRNGKKFHIRAYVLAIGGFRVFVHREMLVIDALCEYVHPSEPNALQSALTNTSLQTEKDRDANRHRYWDSFADDNWKEKTFEQICEITAEVFEAGANLIFPGKFGY